MSDDVRPEQQTVQSETEAWQWQLPVRWWYRPLLRIMAVVTLLGPLLALALLIVQHGILALGVLFTSGVLGTVTLIAWIIEPVAARRMEVGRNV